MANPKDYKAIAAWGDRMGSLPYYIEAQQQRAAKENAPLNAVHWSDDKNKWVTTDDLPPEHPLSTAGGA